MNIVAMAEKKALASARTWGDSDTGAPFAACRFGQQRRDCRAGPSSKAGGTAW
jgi:hypothetical protein